MVRSYLSLHMFAFGLLVGIQVPGFIEAYAQHVEPLTINERWTLHEPSQGSLWRLGECIARGRVAEC